MMRLEYYGRTCVGIELDEKVVLINPEFSRNPDNFRNLDQIKTNVIVLTKYQPKCLDDVITIAKNNDAIVIANHAVCAELEKRGINKKNLRRCFVGLRVMLVTYGLELKFVPSLTNSNIGGMLAMGVIVKWDNVKIYHDGYSAYYSDMKLLGDEEIDYALLTLSEYSSKDVDVAPRILEDIKPKFYIPMMYSEYERYKMRQFKEKMMQKYPNIIGVLLDPNCSVLIKK